MNLYRRLLRFLRARGFVSTKNIIDAQKKSYILANHCLRIYYVFGFYFIALYINEFSTWSKLEEISALWPVMWINLTGIRFGVFTILILFTLSTILSSMFPNKRIFRLLYFLSFAQFAAFDNSFGKIGHAWHAWIAVGFMFIFVPANNGLDTISKRHTYLTAYLGSQILVMLFYSLSGFWKIFYGLIQAFKGEVHSLSPEALSYHISNRLTQTNSSSFFGEFLMNHTYISWPVYLFVIYLELLSIIAAFRPSIHRTWGLLLILFHIGSYLSLTIIFKPTILLLGFLFICSPFIYFEKSLKESLIAFPLLETIFFHAGRIIKR